ncbi:MAG: MerR family transcriptional regulator [Anaerolineales bacterium]|nr:MerR family transcriptional regulator [Anaerolineales bacterium]
MTRPPKFLRTSDIAREVGVHPNTVRLYEQWGFIQPARRSRNGYRQFTQAHLDQMKLARLAMQFGWLSGDIRLTARQVILRGAAGDLGGALELAYRLRTLVQAERAQAEAAADFLERWAAGALADATHQPLWIGAAARLLEVTPDRLRNWERNRLIRTPRDPDNGYRLYGAAQIGRLRVIRALATARYSQMAILRMMTQFDQGQVQDLRRALDTPRPDEDVYYATDRWLSTLVELGETASQIIAHLEMMIYTHSRQPGM